VTKTLKCVDLGAMFNIDMAPEANADFPADMCAKCNGTGTFLGYSGKLIGDCFTCQGTGLREVKAAPVKPGDCPKCAGSGEWRAGRSCFACNGTGKEAVAAIDVSAITVAFATAFASGIKRPKLRLGAFLFARAPDTGRNAGSIYVTRSGEYLGKVTVNRFHGRCDDPTTAEIVAVASDPSTAAKAFGQTTGSCSCCGRELTNGESIALGIGQICAEKFSW